MRTSDRNKKEKSTNKLNFSKITSLCETVTTERRKKNNIDKYFPTNSVFLCLCFVFFFGLSLQLEVEKTFCLMLVWSWSGPPSRRTSWCIKVCPATTMGLPSISVSFKEYFSYVQTTSVGKSVNDVTIATALSECECSQIPPIKELTLGTSKMTSHKYVF